LVVPVTTIRVGAAARFRHGVLQDLGRRVWQVGSLSGSVDRDGHLQVGVAALGGDYARLRLDCRLEGRGATGDLSSVYLGDGDQMLDLRTFQTHAAPDTTSHLLFKGGVAGRSHSVYTGLIRIAAGARGAHAEQTNRNLKLSEEAWAESVPNLEIENNDVRCSHASTVGPVDPDQRFYLESRGVPTDVADRLIVRGFFDEVLDDFATPVLSAEIAGRLDATLAGSAGVGVDRSSEGGS
ncbi:MAG TPA: SufD family Fe-S cluster assembly protein, partial [Microthrixaceae bacterium]|nr:SufD family Fe-S cluster assembly protein [Microthrixaceae bacterium]